MAAQALKQIFGEGRYILLATATGLTVFILSTWLPNLGLVWQIATSEAVPLADKVKILVALMGSIGTNFTIFSASSAVAVSALFGMNVATIGYYFRSQRRVMTQDGKAVTATSLGGLASGLLGIGCATCGTFVLSPTLTFIGAGAFIAQLPLGGEEFGVLGIAILVLALFLGARKIGQPILCRTTTAEPHKTGVCSTK